METDIGAHRDTHIRFVEAGRAEPGRAEPFLINSIYSFTDTGLDKGIKQDVFF